MKMCDIYIVFICIGLLGIGACENPHNPSMKKEQQEEVYDWKQEGFKALGELEEQQEYWADQYIPLEYEENRLAADAEQLVYMESVAPTCVNNNKIYRLNPIVNPPYLHAKSWILDIYDVQTQEHDVQEFSYEQIGQSAKTEGYLVDMDVIDDENYIFQWVELEENEEGEIGQTVSRMIYTDLKDQTQCVDLWDTYVEKGIEEVRYSKFSEIPQGNCLCDGKGNTYFTTEATSDENSKLYAFDKQGNVLLEYQAPAGQLIEKPMKTSQGELIYPVYDIDTKSYLFMWPDITAKQMQSVGQLAEEQDIIQMYGMQGRDVFYETAEGIVKWDIESGQRRLVFCYQENGIARNYQTMLLFRDQQTPVLRLYKNADAGAKDWLAYLSIEEIDKPDDIRVVDLVDSSSSSKQIAGATAFVSRENLNVSCVYEGADGDAEDYRNQIFAELTAGEGPDFLYVSRSDMKLLQEKGLLLDLNSYIPEDVKEKILPGALELGTVGQELMGIPTSVEAFSMVVASSVWQKDSWKLADMIALMDAGTLENRVYYADAESYFSPLALCNMLLKYSLSDSFLIDWEKGESHFDDPAFVHFLEVISENEDVEADTTTWLSGGQRLAFFSFNSLNAVDTFGIQMDLEEGHFVGLPTEGDSGNYLDTDGLLVVNVNTKHTEVIEEFLLGLLSDEIQGICESDVEGGLSVLKLPADEVEEDAPGEYWWRGIPLTLMSDKTTSLDKAEDFFEDCKAAPICYPKISDIIYEELEAMCSGDVSARQAAEAIDSRVQIYLDERQ